MKNFVEVGLVVAWTRRVIDFFFLRCRAKNWPNLVSLFSTKRKFTCEDNSHFKMDKTKRAHDRIFNGTTTLERLTKRFGGGPVKSALKTCT